MFRKSYSKRLLVSLLKWLSRSKTKRILVQVLLVGTVWSAIIFILFTFNRESAKLKIDDQMMNTKVNNSNDHSSEKDLAARREVIKDMMRHAWNGYVKYAWGHNEFKPLLRTGFSPNFLQTDSKLGLTIVDALDTLHIMDLKDEFGRGRQWIEDNLNWNNVSATVSVFEVTIRYVGGLLSIYALTNDTMFLYKAEHIANKLLPAFRTKSGLPKSYITLTNGTYTNKFAPTSNLAEVGSSHLEFVYLSDVTGNPIFKERVKKARDVIYKATPPDGLYPDQINVNSGQWTSDYVTFGARADSFYEYLLKAWIQSNGEDRQANEMFLNVMKAAKKRLRRRSKGGLYYLAVLNLQFEVHEMEHLTCFTGGILALAAKEMSGNVSKEFLKMGEELAKTCHESYVRTATGLGPEKFSFAGGAEAMSSPFLYTKYILRPEVVETYFYLWRITNDQKYRNWAWDVVVALNKHCEVENGFVGITNVNIVNSYKDDLQQSFFLAETLKYLYLIFADDALLPLDKWVFNTEAHPLPIKDRNDAYRRRFDFQPEATRLPVIVENDEELQHLYYEAQILPLPMNAWNVDGPVVAGQSRNLGGGNVVDNIIL